MTASPRATPTSRPPVTREPALWRRSARTLRHLTRRSTSAWRMTPDFLVIGAQKSGTSSVYGHLAQHPDVRPAVRKEPHYFDEHYARGWAWYRSQFPLREPGDGHLTGEATPSYLLHEPVPARVARDLPDARLVAVLRDPVDRALSQYHHEVALGYESRTFEEALALEPDRLRAAAQSATARAGAMTHALKHHAYLARGRYAEQLVRWYVHVPRERLLVVVAEELYADPADVMREVFAHVGLPEVRLASYVPRNQRRYPPMAAGLEARLRDHFAPLNADLAALLGRPLPWA